MLSLFLLSGRAFEESKNEDARESSKLVLKMISFLLAMYIYVL